MIRPALTVAACLAAVSVAAADVVTLRDGSEIEGDVRRVGDGYEITTADGDVRTVPTYDVAGLRRGGRAGGAATDAEAALSSLKRTVLHLDDLAEIVARYDRFLDQFGDRDADLRTDAQAERDKWQRRLAEGRVRFRGKWVTPAAQRLLAKRALDEVNKVRLLIKAGDDDEARRQLRVRLRAEPSDVSALYLLALLDHRRGDVVSARERYETLADREPRHAPTLNNLAIVLVDQNQLPRAAVFMERALAASPGSKSLLDNAAELLHLIETDDGVVNNVGDNLLGRLRARFERQDEQLAARLAGDGWNRWGSKWVDDETMTKIEAAREEIDRDVLALRQAYQGRQQQLQLVRNEIAAGRQLMRDLERSGTFIDINGIPRKRPPPPSFYETQARVANLEAEADRIAAELPRIEAEAEQVRTRLPVPPYDGRLDPINEDGVPVVMPLPEEPAEEPMGELPAAP